MPPHKHSYKPIPTQEINTLAIRDYSSKPSTQLRKLSPAFLNCTFILLKLGKEKFKNPMVVAELNVIKWGYN